MIQEQHSTRGKKGFQSSKSLVSFRTLNIYFFYLGEFLGIGKIIHSNGQKDVEQSVWSDQCSGLT